MKCVFLFGICTKGIYFKIFTMEKKISIWYDKEGDFLEVLFDIKPGFFKDTDDDAIMEKVDNEGNILGFSILKVSELQRQKPLSLTLKSKTA